MRDNFKCRIYGDLVHVVWQINEVYAFLAERVDFRKWKDGKWEMVEGKFSCSIYSILVYLSCVILCFLFNELIFY